MIERGTVYTSMLWGTFGILVVATSCGVLERQVVENLRFVGSQRHQVGTVKQVDFDALVREHAQRASEDFSEEPGAPEWSDRL